MLEHLTASQYVAMGVTVLVGACFQGIAGIGFSIVAAPVCALLFPELVPGPLLLLGLPLSTMGWWREGRDVLWDIGVVALVGRLAGAALAAALLLCLPARMIGVVFALCVLAAVACSGAGWRLSASRRNVALAGIASGVMSTVTSAGGPPFAIVMQQLPPAALRATLSCIFTIGTVISLAALYGLGSLGTSGLGLAALLLPWLLAGFAISTRLMRRISHAGIRQVLLALAAFSAIGVLVQAWIG